MGEVIAALVFALLYVGLGTMVWSAKDSTPLVKDDSFDSFVLALFYPVKPIHRLLTPKDREENR